ncbi:MAG: hypothetical protein WCI92_06550 [Bacteroidota bacterium]
MRLFTLQKFSILAVVFIAMACAKEKTEVISQSNLVNDDQLVNQVNWFMDAAKDVKEGNYLKSGEKMYLDSALYYIGSTLNYKYGFSAEPFNKLTLDTVYVNIPYIAAEGKTYIVDALQGYNLTVDQLRLKYQNISSSKKFLIGCVIQNAGMTSNNSSIIVRVIGQFGSDQPTAPISYDAAYWWERNSYKCDGTGEEGAPNRIDADINFAKRPIPAPGYKVVFTDLIIEQDAFSNPDDFRTPNDVEDNFCDYKLYYASSQVGPLTSEVGCLGEDAAHPGIDEMIFYRDGMNVVLSNWLTLHGRDFVSVYTISEGVNTNIWKHWPWLTHGIKHIVQIDPSNPYPINIQD